MKNTIEETTRLLLNGTLSKEDADKILLNICSVMPSLPLQDLVEFCERQEDFYNDEENYSKDANTFYNAAFTFTKFWAEKTYGNGA